jgi:DNA-directed RNA polymerase subunit F
LRHVVALEDEDDINLQMIKLKKLIPEGPGFDAEQEIITEIVNNNFETASSLIEDYCRTRKQIAVYIDPEIGELRLELKALEIQVSTLEAENQELEHTLHAFQYRHSIELGELLRKILLLRQEHLRKETKLQPEKEDEYKEAQKDYQEFEEDYRSSREKVVASLLPEEQQELKSIFKASVKLCHSDLVTAEHKKEATKFYIKVVEAYKGNDLAAIRELYENLQHGSFAVASETLNDLQRLHSQIVRMRAAATILAKQIRSLRDSVVIGRWQKLTIGMVTIRPQSSSCRMNWPGWRERYEREEQGACSPWEECSCHRGETTTAYR